MAKESFFSVGDIFKDRRKLTVFLICLGLSLLSWILISLGKDFSTTLIVPVKYVNFPENKTLLNDVPQKLAVSVSGSGFDLLQFDDRLTDDTLTINLDNLNIGVFGGFQRGYLDQAEVSKDLQRRLKGALSIQRVISDSIVFVFDLKVSRVLQVSPRVSFEPAPGYVQVGEVLADPTEVEVYGALSILDTMNMVQTETIELGQVDETKRVKVALARNVIGRDAQTAVDSIEVEVPIDRLTERSFMLSPTIANLPDSLDILLFPSSVEVTVQVPISEYENVNAAEISLKVDYQDIQEGYLVLPVRLLEWPSNVERATVKPEQVEIVLERKE